MESIQNCIPELLQEETPEKQEIKNLDLEAKTILTKAKMVIVRTTEDYVKASADFSQIKNMIKITEAERVKRTGPINETLRLINADFKRIKDTLEEALKPYEQGMLAYKQEEARQRKEAEDTARKERERIEAEARAKAQEEMDRLEAARKEQEAAAQRIAQAEAEANPVAAFVAKQQAAQAEADAEAAKLAAEDALREAALAPRAVMTAAAPKITAAGTSYRTTWKFRIVDLNLVPREYLLPNEQLLGSTARTTKGAQTIPGVEFYAEQSIGGR